MSERYIKTPMGSIRAKLVEDKDVIKLYTPMGSYLAQYNKKDDTTRTTMGSIVGYGNTLADFIPVK